VPLPEFTKRLIEARLLEYCHDKVPNHSRQKLKIHFKIRVNTVTLFESRPYHLDPSVWTNLPIARFRYNAETKKWELCYTDDNSNWHPYTKIEPSADFDVLLKEIDDDTSGIFWI
jgi:Protein of unknown function (DUF3024)